MCICLGFFLLHAPLASDWIRLVPLASRPIFRASLGGLVWSLVVNDLLLHISHIGASKRLTVAHSERNGIWADVCLSQLLSPVPTTTGHLTSYSHEMLPPEGSPFSRGQWYLSTGTPVVTWHAGSSSDVTLISLLCFTYKCRMHLIVINSKYLRPCPLCNVGKMGN